MVEVRLDICDGDFSMLYVAAFSHFVDRLELADERIIFATEGRINDATRALASAI